MKLFQNFQKFLAFGVVRAKETKDQAFTSKAKDQSSVQTEPLSLLNLLAPINFGCGVLLTLIYLLFEAKDFVEYSEAFYPFATSLLNVCNVSVFIQNGGKIFQLIDHLENTVNESE